MMPENNNTPESNNRPADGGEGGDINRMVDASQSDAAAENKRESERIQEASRAAVPAFQIDDEKLDKDAEGREERDAEANRPLTTQGTEEEIGENFSGSTNLTLEQLKKERDPGGFSLEGEEPEDRSF
jgi:hypothetical protein